MLTLNKSQHFAPLFECTEPNSIDEFQKSEYKHCLDSFYLHEHFSLFLFNLVELSLLSQKQFNSFNKENRIIRISGSRQIGHTDALYKLLRSKFCQNADCLIVFNNQNFKSRFIKTYDKATMPNYDLRTCNELFALDKKYDFILVDTAQLIEQQFISNYFLNYLKSDKPACLILLG